MYIVRFKKITIEDISSRYLVFGIIQYTQDMSNFILNIK